MRGRYISGKISWHRPTPEWRCWSSPSGCVNGGKKKVKVTQEYAMKSQRGSESIALLFFNLYTRWGG